MTIVVWNYWIPFQANVAPMKRHTIVMNFDVVVNINWTLHLIKQWLILYVHHHPVIFNWMIPISQIQKSKHVRRKSFWLFESWCFCFCLALETIKNLRIVNVSSVSRQIEVEFDKLSGCFDRWILICESLSSKQRRNFSNSTICTELIPDESYRIHIEIERTGWDTVRSNSIKTKLDSTSNPNQGKKSISLDWSVFS